MSEYKMFKWKTLYTDKKKKCERNYDMQGCWTRYKIEGKKLTFLNDDCGSKTGLIGFDYENKLVANEIMVYPNPAINEVHFNKPVSFTLLNMQGQIIASYQEPITILDISQLQNGLYIIKTNEDKVLKLLIEK